MRKRIPLPYRITFLYIIFGAVWILFSDKLVVYFTEDPHQIQHLSTYKGWLYVLVTGILLFYFIRKEIRRRNQLFNELLEAKRKADEADRLKTTFLSNLSHYIRTPMNSILGFIDLIEDKDTSPENHQLFLTYINESSRNLLQTLNSIVEISRIQSGQAQIRVEPLSLNRMIENAAGLARLGIIEKNKPVDVETHFHWPDGEDHIHSDPEKLFLVMTNLISNAERFTHAGKIQIGYEPSGDQILLKVRDTGPGIPPEKQDSLFTNFLQNNENYRISGEGPGLGLVLSSNLARILNGDLSLEETGPEGSTFCLRLPVDLKQEFPASPNGIRV